jgi:hypothetical protein
LALLRQAGVVACRKEGLRVIYWVRDPAVFTLCDLAWEHVSRRLAELAALAADF